jgi:hypothetical protein
MPIHKKDNMKNAPIEKRDSAIVPKKEEAHRLPKVPEPTAAYTPRRVTALATAGRKKRPK